MPRPDWVPRRGAGVGQRCGELQRKCAGSGNRSTGIDHHRQALEQAGGLGLAVDLVMI
jgi:hypothetical protein